MKILYATQATGNGHLTRAAEIIPCLEKIAEVDTLVSGTFSDVPLDLRIKYRSKGLSLAYDRKGGLRYWKILSNLAAFPISEIHQLPVEKYDLVINDYEPISAWACRLKKKRYLSVGHQAALLAPDTPRPQKGDLIGQSVIKYYAPAKVFLGFHFRKYDERIETPVIRQEVRRLQPGSHGYYVVYLPAYDDRHLADVLSRIPVEWRIFSIHTKQPYTCGNLRFFPISKQGFSAALSCCDGVMTSAGFETPAEVLYLGKKLLVIPIAGQYEQQCNAEALKEMGVPALRRLSVDSLPMIERWISEKQRIAVDYRDNMNDIISRIMVCHRDHLSND